MKLRPQTIVLECLKSIVSIEIAMKSLGMLQKCYSTLIIGSVTRKKSPNVYKSCPINYFCRKMIDFDTFTKLPKNVGDLGKLIVAKGFKKLPKVQ